MGWERLRCTPLPMFFLNGGAQWCCMGLLPFPVVQDIIDGSPQNSVLYGFACHRACFLPVLLAGCGAGKRFALQGRNWDVGLVKCFLGSPYPTVRGDYWEAQLLHPPTALGCIQPVGQSRAGGRRREIKQQQQKKGNSTCCKASEFPNKPESAENTFYKHAAKLAAFVWAFVKH